MTAGSVPRRRADALRNRAAILAAGRDVLSSRPDAGLAEVAAASGLTRTTVYAHFASREDLLEELLRAAIDETVRSIDDGQPGTGPADDALLRVVAGSWRSVGAHAELLDGAARALGERATQLHAAVQDRVLDLLRRGRREGTFRSDLPERWMLTTYFALVHAAGRDVALGALDPAEAGQALARTLLSAFAAPPAPEPDEARA
jgi:TetR/AcrR family transcriptional repressor of mexCD-oprJ operon